MRVAGVEGGGGGSPLRTATRARPRLDQRKLGGGAASPLHGSAAGPPRPPHSPRPRPRAAAAVTAAVAAPATAAAPSAAATPDDDRAAILGALRQRRKAAPAFAGPPGSALLRKGKQGFAQGHAARALTLPVLLGVDEGESLEVNVGCS